VLIELQRVLQAALASDKPLEVLREGARGLPAEARAIVERIDSDGFVVSSLLVRKLRFERICRGDTALEEWFDREPASFTEIFRAYNQEVPPREFFPQPEALAFREFLRRKGITAPGSKELPAGPAREG
jgi:hypothetical protein